MDGNPRDLSILADKVLNAVKKGMKNNAFFLQEENVTVALLASKEPSDRIKAFDLIKEARERCCQKREFR